MSRWLRFFMERLPPVVLLLTCGGMVLTSQALATGTIRWPMTFWALGLAVIFFLELRLMDEVKDATKDEIAHRDRPIPRGLLALSEAERGIKVGLMIMIGMSFITIFVNPRAGALYFITTAYLWLMGKEFFLGHWLEARPFLYAVTHQVVILPLCGSLALMAAEFPAIVDQGILFAVGLFYVGSFFSYEICRKLDPTAHPILATYRSVYGLIKTGLILLFTISLLLVALWLLLSVLGTVGTGLIALTGIATLVCYAFCAQRHYKLVENTASLLLLLTLWLPFLIIAIF